MNKIRCSEWVRLRGRLYNLWRLGIIQLDEIPELVREKKDEIPELVIERKEGK